ncbi:hypothetical protein SAMN05192558_10428 [Actinokineospora alba]|uniref:Transposase DDE domain-containing protein n=1 Tax=Actinokineospora alba TaxID=504798 RepID=A0A1H0L670_9PSEU|nr:hypothetical protein SAMN05421871_109271 [Actinokineospora alba]SDO63717.1 hypothetical protein SAMN05192558_10428 [Actinokineospora alba]
MRHARAHLGHLFGYLPLQPGYNKRLRNAAGLITTVIRTLAVDTTLWTDDVWVVDSTPVECGRSRETAKSKDFETDLDRAGIELLRPARKGEPERPGARLFKPLRQTIESINQTLKGQLDLEHHGARTPTGVIVRVLQRILALTAAIWHNDKTGQPIKRSLTAYDH